MMKAIILFEGLDDLDLFLLMQCKAVVLSKLSGDLGRENFIVLFPVKFFQFYSECPFNGIIRIDVAPVDVFYPRKARQVLHKSREQLFAFPESFFALHLFDGKPYTLADNFEQSYLGFAPFAWPVVAYPECRGPLVVTHERNRSEERRVGQGG